MKKIVSTIILTSLVALFMAPAATAVDKSKPNWRNKMTKPEVMTFDKATDYFWVLETNKGTIKIKLMPEVAPMHVTSTIYLTEAGFYDSLTFHRVLKGFMAQGGCPNGNGRGGPGYFFGNETSPDVKHDRPFLLSMANTGRPNSNGSQFFITFRPTPGLNGKHSIFGEVVEGQSVVKTFESLGAVNPNVSQAPAEKLIIKKATIVKTKQVGEPSKAAQQFTPGSCCDKANKAGKACGHGCCKKAAKAGEVCSACNKTKKAAPTPEATSKFKPGSCCAKAEKAGKTCGHGCCKKAAASGKVCAKCND